MDPAEMVHTDPTLTLVGFIVVIALLLLLITKLKWHVFLALLLPILLFGLIPGVNIDNFIEAFEEGFGSTLGGIGVIIVLGCLIGEALKHTGAITTITNGLINLIGKSRMPLVLTVVGFVLGIAIFSDVAYVILNPIVHSASAASGMSVGAMATGLVGSLQLTHALVPPTPGPIAAAGLIGADLGMAIIFGAFVCLVGSLAAWLYGMILGRYIYVPASEEFIGDSFLDSARTDENEGPSQLNSYAPIAIPVILIGAQSISNLVLAEGHTVRIALSYIGWPVIALSVGAWLAYRNVKYPEDKSKFKNEWVENALRTSAMILVVTGLGGSLSNILEGTPAVEAISSGVVDAGLPVIFLPFIIAVIGNMITGSTTVGVITAGSLVEPMLADLALSPEAAFLAAGSGAVIIKYFNSSYFWVCTSLSRVGANNGLFFYGGATLVAGIVTMATTYLLWVMGIV